MVRLGIPGRLDLLEQECLERWLALKHEAGTVRRLRPKLTIPVAAIARRYGALSNAETLTLIDKSAP